MEEAFRERSEREIRDYVSSAEPRKLQLGAGPMPLDGWLNSDIEPFDRVVYLDASKPFPLEDASFRYIFSEHVIEHLPLEGGDVMLAESYRILEPGGKIRIATPDLDRLLALFDEELDPKEQQYLKFKPLWARLGRAAAASSRQ